jgi:radical SAM-linked protein
VNRPPEPAPPSEPRQRWRITFARDPVAADAVGRALLDAWQAAVESTDLPVARQAESGGRIRMAFAAPLPAAARGEREWMDLWLVDRVPAWRVRETLEPRLPEAHAWVDAEDVWLGAPALAGQVAAADWRIEIEPVDATALSALAAAAGALASAQTIPRVRTKGTEQKAYDLRPLLGDVAVEESGARLTVVARTRFHPELGAGRPEEVVAALAEAAGVPLAIAAMTRIRLVLADGLGAGRRR